MKALNVIFVLPVTYGGNNMVTIRDVAKLAGVSAATVSRYINKSGYVSDKAEIKIAKAIKKLNYHPNEIARSLFSKKLKMIGLIIPDMSNPYFTEVAKGVEEKANSLGYGVILLNAENVKKHDQNIHFVNQFNISGVLTASGIIEQNELNVPIVYLDRADPGAEFAVYLNNYKGGKIAAEAILDGKPKKVAIITGPKELTVARERLEGAKEVLKENNIDFQIVETNSYSIEEAKKFAADFFSKHLHIDSIISSNDIFALALINQASKLGIKVPDEVQIIGFDNIAFSQLSIPSITTIEQSAGEIGYSGAELLLNQILKKKNKNKKIIIEPKLIERESLRKS